MYHVRCPLTTCSATGAKDIGRQNRLQYVYEFMVHILLASFFISKKCISTLLYLANDWEQICNLWSFLISYFYPTPPRSPITFVFIL